MGNLRIGTCSWKYPSWQGLVYSASRGVNYLKEYARQFDTVEVDQWFWSLFKGAKVKLPDPDVVAQYRSDVHDGFRFTVKVPNSITLTHYYKKTKSDPLEPNPHFLSPALFREFVSRLEPIKSLLGPLIFQFEYLNKQKMSSRSLFFEKFAHFIGQLPDDYTYAVEPRNANYLDAGYFAFLQRHRLSHVFLQGYWMPPITGLFHHHKPFIYRQKHVVIRLHGPGRGDIEKLTGKKWGEIVTPKDDELRDIVRMTSDILDRGTAVYLSVNNHYEGSAPRTIDRIRRLLQNRP